jgi:hypothetical protein
MSSPVTEAVEKTNTKRNPSNAIRTILEEKICLNVSRLLVNPACTAGVRTSRPNFSARCGLPKL